MWFGLPRVVRGITMSRPYWKIPAKQTEKRSSRIRTVPGGRTFSFPSAKYQENWDRIFGKKSNPADVN